MSQKRKHENIPNSAGTKIAKSDESNIDDDLFLVYEEKEFSKAIFHLGILKDKQIILIGLVNTIDGQLRYLNRSIGFKLRENVYFLKNKNSLSGEQFNKLKSNILELNKLEIGDTIQWPLESFSFAYHRAIITELNINPKIIHLYQLDGAASSTGLTAASTTSSITALSSTATSASTSASTSATSAASCAAVCCSGVNGRVSKENLLDYIYEKEFSKFLYQNDMYSSLIKRSPDKIVKKAIELLGPSIYDLPTYNCQNFCIVCTFSNKILGNLSDGVRDATSSVLSFAGGAILIFGVLYLSTREKTNKKEEH